MLRAMIPAEYEEMISVKLCVGYLSVRFGADGCWLVLVGRDRFPLTKCENTPLFLRNDEQGVRGLLVMWEWRLPVAGIVLRDFGDSMIFAY